MFESLDPPEMQIHQTHMTLFLLIFVLYSKSPDALSWEEQSKLKYMFHSLR